LAKREELRAKKLGELNKKLADQLALEGPDALSEGLKLAVETYLVTERPARESFKHDPRISALIKKPRRRRKRPSTAATGSRPTSSSTGRTCCWRKKGRTSRTPKRLGMRLNMIRLYAPESFWKLRNDERIKENAKLEKKKPPLPPYNGLGEDFREKAGIDRRGHGYPGREHGERQQVERVTLKDEMLAGSSSSARW